MTKHKTDGQLGDMPDFDPIEMKRQIQAEIRRGTERMTDTEILEYAHWTSKEFQEEGRRYCAERAMSGKK